MISVLKAHQEPTTTQATVVMQTSYTLLGADLLVGFLRITDADAFGFGTEDAGATNDSTANGNRSLGLSENRNFVAYSSFC